MTYSKTRKPTKLFYIFIAIFIIIPDYFYINLGIGNMEFQIIWPCIFAVIFAMFMRGIIVSANKIKNLMYVCWIWVLCRLIVGLLHLDIVDSFTLLVRFAFIIVFFLNLVDNKNKFLKIIDVIIFTGVAVSAFGFIEEFTSLNIFECLNTVGATLNYNVLRFGVLRIISFTSHAITYGVFCMMVLALVFYRISNCKQKAKKLYVIAYVLILINLLLTLSRSSIVVFILCQILLLWKCGLTKFIKRMAEITVLIFLFCFIGSFLSSTINSIIINVIYSVLAVFDDSYVSLLYSAYQGDNVAAIGNRIQLFAWVWDSVKDNILIGFGAASKFTYNYINSSGYNVTKESIEVHYLSLLYHYGIVGLFPEILLYVSLLRNSFKKNIMHNQWESKLQFSDAFWCILVSYLCILFAVGQSTEQGLFFVLIGLLLAYYKNNRFVEG